MCNTCELHITNNSQLFKRLYRAYLVRKGKIRCGFCRPNHWENFSRKDHDRMERLKEKFAISGDVRPLSRADIWN
jgi:hypothetical protein